MELATALAFARDRSRGILITLKADGRPQSSHIGYVVEPSADGAADTIAMSVTASRAKSKNARRDPRVSLHIPRDDFGAYVVIEGTAELTLPAADPNDDTVDQLVAYYRSMIGEHPDWDDYRAAMVRDGRLVLRIHPTHAYGMLPA